MNKYQVLGFISSVLIVLGLICALFPEEGIAIAKTEINFPTLAELFEAQADTVENPADVIARREKAAHAEKIEEFENYFETDPARFYFPRGDIHFFDAFFEALDGADTAAVNIVHYGDSQIEEDRISREIRRELQSRFGGGGPGLIPACTYHSLTVSERSTREGTRYFAYGAKELRAGIRQYGPMASFTRVDSVLRYNIYIDPRDKSSAGCSGVQVLTGNRTSAVTLSCKGVRRTLPVGKSLVISDWERADSTKQVIVNMSGSADVYGIRLYKHKGVNLDNIAMRGCSGTVFTSLDSTQLKQYFSETNTRLIILQYGGNSVPYAKTESAIQDYKDNLSRQIRLIRRLAPQALVIFIGPSDMSTTIKGKRCTYPHLPAVVEALKAAAVENGAAFWDMYSAMGGYNSMVKWVSSKPALAGSDHVHFTPKGAAYMGKMFSSSLMMYYDYYQLLK